MSASGWPHDTPARWARGRIGRRHTWPGRRGQDAETGITCTRHVARSVILRAPVSPPAGRVRCANQTFIHRQGAFAVTAMPPRCLPGTTPVGPAGTRCPPGEATEWPIAGRRSEGDVLRGVVGAVDPVGDIGDMR